MSAIDPFPDRYPAAATPDATLQTALDNARAGLPAGQQPTIADVPITLIALGDETPYAAASFRGDEMDYSASMLKIAALYAAHELRAAAQRLADAVRPTDTAQLIAALRLQFDPVIKTAFSTISTLAHDPGSEAEHPGINDITDEHVLPHYEQVLQLNAGQVEFLPEYMANIKGMIVDGHNPEAAKCIHGLGYGYINGVLTSGAFFEPIAPGGPAGIWLCGDFMQQWPYIRVTSANDRGVAQATTTNQMARLVALIADGTLPGSTDPGGMLDLLAQGGRWFDNPSEPPVIWGIDEPVEVTHAKVGQGPLKSGTTVVSEAEIVHEKRTDNRFVVVWQNLKGGATQANLRAVAKVVEDAIEAFVGP
jgi:hypothetical protein